MTTLDHSVSKQCRRCNETKTLEAFHKQPTGPMGRHSWCKACVNQYARETRNPRYTREQRQQWNLMTRYRMRESDLARMLSEQNHTCAICRQPMKRMCIDHDHKTGKVRGLLCHFCNIRLATIEDRLYLEAATEYLRQRS